MKGYMVDDLQWNVLEGFGMLVLFVALLELYRKNYRFVPVVLVQLLACMHNLFTLIRHSSCD